MAKYVPNSCFRDLPWITCALRRFPHQPVMKLPGSAGSITRWLWNPRGAQAIHHIPARTSNACLAGIALCLATGWASSRARGPHEGPFDLRTAFTYVASGMSLLLCTLSSAPAAGTSATGSCRRPAWTQHFFSRDVCLGDDHGRFGEARDRRTTPSRCKYCCAGV